MQQNAIEALSGREVICYGTSPGLSKQRFLQQAARAGASLTILKFPGEDFMVDIPCTVIPAAWNEVGLNVSQQGRVYDGAVTYDELHVMRLSMADRVLNLKKSTLDEQVARVCRDKRLMKQRFLQSGVPTAPFRIWASKTDLSRSLEALGVVDEDYILKPALGAASAGVLHVHAGTSLEVALREFDALCHSGSAKAGYSPIVDPPFLVEKYLHRNGVPVELAVDGYVRNGSVSIVMTSEKVDMVKTGPFVENKYVSPPLSDFVVSDEQVATDVAIAAVQALGINDSVFHCELRYDGDQISVLEIGTRPGGGLISESSSYRTGVDLRLQHMLLALGQPLQGVETRECSTCFGTLYYEPGFDVDRLPLIEKRAREGNLFYECRQDAQKRKHVLHDWLIAFGVTANTPQASCEKFYNHLDEFKAILG